MQLLVLGLHKISREDFVKFKPVFFLKRKSTRKQANLTPSPMIAFVSSVNQIIVDQCRTTLKQIEWQNEQPLNFKRDSKGLLVIRRTTIFQRLRHQPFETRNFSSAKEMVVFPAPDRPTETRNTFLATLSRTGILAYLN